MRKQIFIGFATVLAIVSLITANVHLSNKSSIVDINLAQIEALADESGGTETNYCYEKSMSSSSASTKIPCDYRTDASTIYPCENKRYDFYGNQDRCTK